MDLDSETVVLMIPIVAIIFGCGIPITSIFFDYRRKRAIYEMYHQERLAAIDRGMDIPPLPDSFFHDEETRVYNPRKNLLKGLIWLAIGGGLGIAMFSNQDGSTPLALIPIGVGFSYLIYYAIEGRKEPIITLGPGEQTSLPRT